MGNALGDKNRFSGSLFELTPEQIVQLARERGARDPEDGWRWWTFFHRRIAGPIGILAFALLAVPIAASRRGGRAFGYGATLLSVVLYYAVLRFGEGLAQRGAVPPWLGPNLANLACVVAGLLATALMARKGPGAVR